MKDLSWRRLLIRSRIQRGFTDCHWWVLELISIYNPVIWMESRGDCSGKMEEVIEGLSNMRTVAWVTGYGGASCYGEKSCDDVRLGSIQSGSRWRVERYSWTVVSGRPLRVYSHTIAHGWSSWTKKCTFRVYGPKWHKLQVYGPKNTLSVFMNLYFQWLRT